MGRLGPRWRVEVDRLQSATRRRIGADAGPFGPARGRRLDDSWIPPGLAPFGVDRARRSDPVTVDRVPGSGRVDQFRRTVQRHRVVVDAAEVGSSIEERARRLVRAAVCGTPVVSADRASLAGVLPESVTATFLAPSDNIADPALYESAAFRQWSAVFDDLVLEPQWSALRRPSVSITISTHRPTFVERWVRQIARQTHRNIEVICVLHSDDFTDGHRSLIASVLADSGMTVTFAEAPTGSSLGVALDAARRIASGDVVLKWDDDDLYSSNHVRDLLRARHYSGAPLVGKACDFVYIGSRDLLVQRHQADRETYSPTLSGNTLMIDRDVLEHVGGWTDVSLGEDASLISRVRRAGGQTYRAMGYGMIAVRQASTIEHTWNLDETKLVTDAVRSWAGLAVDAALIDAESDLIADVRRSAAGGH